MVLDMLDKGERPRMLPLYGCAFNDDRSKSPVQIGLSVIGFDCKNSLFYVLRIAPDSVEKDSLPSVNFYRQYSGAEREYMEFTRIATSPHLPPEFIMQAFAALYADLSTLRLLDRLADNAIALEEVK